MDFLQFLLVGIIHHGFQICSEWEGPGQGKTLDLRWALTESNWHFNIFCWDSFQCNNECVGSFEPISRLQASIEMWYIPRYLLFQDRDCYRDLERHLESWWRRDPTAITDLGLPAVSVIIWSLQNIGQIKYWWVKLLLNIPPQYREMVINIM